MRFKQFAFALSVALLMFAPVLAKKNTMPTLQQGDVGITGKLMPQYVDAAGNVGKVIDWGYIGSVPDGSVRIKSKRVLTDAEVNNLHNASITLIKAPGAGKVIVPHIMFAQISSTNKSLSTTRDIDLNVHWSHSSDAVWSTFPLRKLISRSLAPTPHWMFAEYDASPFSILPNKSVVLRSSARLPSAINGLTAIVYYSIFDLN